MTAADQLPHTGEQPCHLRTSQQVQRAGMPGWATVPLTVVCDGTRQRYLTSAADISGTGRRRLGAVAGTGTGVATADRWCRWIEFL